MGCTGSKSASPANAQQEVATLDVVVATNPAAETHATLGEDSTPVVTDTKAVVESSVVVEVATAQVDEATKEVTAGSEEVKTESLVPKYHIDEFGNKIDDVTGGRVWSEAYYQARKDAEFHAVQRGVCFEKSKKAFEEDHKKEAKELSDEGKLHGQQMEEANQRAVDEILLPQKLEESDKIDLHGLLVAEAVEATKTFIKNHQTRGEKEKLYIITGAGHHSDKAKGPVIKPAIINLCKEENWKLEADENNEGSFTVTLKEA